MFNYQLINRTLIVALCFWGGSLQAETPDDTINVQVYLGKSIHSPSPEPDTTYSTYSITFGNTKVEMIGSQHAPSYYGGYVTRYGGYKGFDLDAGKSYDLKISSPTEFSPTDRIVKYADIYDKYGPLNPYYLLNSETNIGVFYGTNTLAYYSAPDPHEFSSTLHTAKIEKNSLTDIIPVNDGDLNENGTIDHADPDLPSHNLRKLTIKFPGLAKLREAGEKDNKHLRIGIYYSSAGVFSDPKNPNDFISEQISNETPTSPINYRKPSRGYIRIWNSYSNFRSKKTIENKGNYVHPRYIAPYTYPDYSLDDIGVKDETLTLYVEGVNKTQKPQNIVVALYYNGRHYNNGLPYNTRRRREPPHITIPYEVGAAECTACTTCKTLGQADNSIKDNKMDASFSNGKSSLKIQQSTPSATGSNPSSLIFQQKDMNDKVLKDTDGVIKQVHSASGLTKVDIVDENSYTISFYDPTLIGPLVNGFYRTTGDPETVITVSKNPSDINNLFITTMKGTSVTSKVLYSYDPNQSLWRLGEEVSDDNYRFESEKTSQVNGLTQKTSIIEDSDDKILSKVERYYNSSDQLIKEVVDPDGTSLTTLYAYSGNNITRIDNPDGSWETRTYLSEYYLDLTTYSSGKFVKNIYYGNGLLHKTISSFNNSTYTTNENDHQVTVYEYTPVVAGDDGSTTAARARTITQMALGQVISKTWYGYLLGEEITVRAATPNSALTDPANMTSRTYSHTSGDFKDQVYKTIGESGNGSLIVYEKLGDTMTTTSDSGVFNNDFTAIVNGTSTVQIEVNELEVSSHTFDSATGLLISSRTITSRDEQDRETRVDYHDDTFEQSIYTCCNLSSSISRDKVVTTYQYDGLGRQVSSTTNGITNSSVYDAAGQLIRQKQTGTDGTTRVINTSTYDLAGRLTSSKDALNNTTTYSEAYNSGQTTRTTTYPDLTTQIIVTDSEGRLVSSSGTAVYSQPAEVDEESVEFDSDLNYYVLVSKSGNINQWSKNYSDALGRNYKSESSTGAISRSFYNADGKLTKSISASGATSLYFTDQLNNISIQALDVNQNGVIDYGTDVISRSQSDYIEENNIIWNRQQSWQNPASLANPGTPDNTSRQSNDGFARTSTSSKNGIASTFEFRTTLETDGVISTTSTSPDGSYSISKVKYRLQLSDKFYNSNGLLKSSTTYIFDNFNRLSSQTDSRNGATTYTYDLLDRVTSLQTPDPDGTGPQQAQTFSTVYDNMGRRQKVINPDLSEIAFTYTTQGSLETSTGANVYPRRYSYDSEGKFSKLETWKNYGDIQSSAGLQFTYNSQNQLISKTDAFGAETSFTYLANGQISSATNSRGGVKIYHYDSSGRLNSFSYSDNTPTATFSYNELGKISTITDILGTRSFNYNQLGQYTGNTINGGTFDGQSQQTSYDNTGREETFTLTLGADSKAIRYAYNNSGRLSEINTATRQNKYSYLSEAPATVEKLSIHKNDNQQMHFKREFDKIMRTTGFTWKQGE
jgi:YD repeat-containing protein